MIDQLVLKIWMHHNVREYKYNHKREPEKLRFPFACLFADYKAYATKPVLQILSYTGEFYKKTLP